MGAGRVVFQDLTRISEAIKNKSFQQEAQLNEMNWKFNVKMRKCRDNFCFR